MYRVGTALLQGKNTYDQLQETDRNKDIHADKDLLKVRLK
jgi:hypothetical protein